MSDKGKRKARTLADYIRTIQPADPEEVALDELELSDPAELQARQVINEKPAEDAYLGIALMAKMVAGCIIALILVRIDGRLLLPFIFVLTTLISYVSWPSTQDDD